MSVQADERNTALCQTGGFHFGAQGGEVADWLAEALEAAEVGFLAGWDEVPGTLQAGDVGGEEGEGDLVGRGVVLEAQRVRGDVDEFGDCAGAFGASFGQDDLGHDPFDDDVEAGDDQVDTIFAFAAAEVVGPVADSGWVLVPV